MLLDPAAALCLANSFLPGAMFFCTFSDLINKFFVFAFDIGLSSKESLLIFFSHQLHL
jgi:hypothetical protein